MDSVLTGLTAALLKLSVGAQYKILCAFIAIPFAVAAIECIYNVFRGEKTAFAFKYVSVICFSAAVLAASFEYDVKGEIFSSVTAVALYAAISFYVCVLLYGFLNFVNGVLVYVPKSLSKSARRRGENIKNAVLRNDMQAADSSAAPENYGSFGADGLFNGYLNVKYVKYLLDKLKNCDLSVAERKEAEDFEAYLMNFAYRQPNESEREELSPKLNALIRSLAKYKAV